MAVRLMGPMPSMYECISNMNKLAFLYEREVAIMQKHISFPQKLECMNHIQASVT